MNELIETKVTNAWDCVMYILEKVPVETLTKNAPLIITVGGAIYIAERYFKYQCIEAFHAIENGYNYTNGNVSLTKETVVVS